MPDAAHKADNHRVHHGLNAAWQRCRAQALSWLLSVLLVTTKDSCAEPGCAVLPPQQAQPQHNSPQNLGFTDHTKTLAAVAAEVQGS